VELNNTLTNKGTGRLIKREKLNRPSIVFKEKIPVIKNINIIIDIV
jgi:hypothetical protein